ncbi:SMI1/KNR4 family protein [Domibacillus indicus]|uniref:SMI1/KNR4 family protein n=1 Tax=Domibacillus indicus TaxID=1437523 RepID=UPI00069824E3|nr:SMI1/KNR4 family protein [Domibacillus indicus]
MKPIYETSGADQSMAKQYVEQMIRDYEELSLFTGGVGEQEVIEIESELAVALPESYKWFLLNFGSGGVNGSDILGAASNGEYTVVEATGKYRKYGLPEKLIVIEDLGEYVYCLDVSRLKDGDCPVVNWSMHDSDGAIITTSSFYDYLLYSYYDEEEMEEEKLFEQWRKVFERIGELRKQNRSR